MKKIMVRNSQVFILAVISLFFFSSSAEAHVTVMPKTSTTGAWETYTLKVPVEKDMATTKVTIKVPQGVEVMSYQPVPGWTYTTEKDASGKIKTFTFEATGEGILPGQFQQFVYVAKNPVQATKAAWDAFQYYKDGTVVEWTGDEESDAPHSLTDIVTSSTTVQTEKNQTQNTEKTKTEVAEKSTETAMSLPLILSGLATVLALIALFLAIRKK